MTQDEIIEMPEYLNAAYEGDDLYTGDQVRELMKLVAAKEREACVVDIQMHIPRSGRDTLEYKMAMRMIERIKARGEA